MNTHRIAVDGCIGYPWGCQGLHGQLTQMMYPRRTFPIGPRDPKND